MTDGDGRRRGAAALPLRILVAVARPGDAPPFDAESVWNALAGALKPLEAQGLVVVERLSSATEQALKARLGKDDCHVLHFIGHAMWRRAAQYGTLTFENSSGAARGLTTQYLAGVLAQSSAIGLTVVQTPAQAGTVVGSGATSSSEGARPVLVAEGMANGRIQEVFALKLYASLATGSTLLEAIDRTRTALTSIGGPANLVLTTGAPGARIVDREPAAVSAASDAKPAPAAPSAAPGSVATAAAEREPERLARQRELERKRAAAEFDVFLCHNTSDKPAVKRIAEHLEARGILAWLDEWELPPGQPWQPLLEKQIANIKSAAVFVGAAGVGPWQEQEIYGFLREFVSRKSPVIPVMLEDAPAKPELPIFLRAMTWVDFRVADPDPFSRLVWGITGRRPHI